MFLSETRHSAKGGRLFPETESGLSGYAMSDKINTKGRETGMPDGAEGETAMKFVHLSDLADPGTGTAGGCHDRRGHI